MENKDLMEVLGQALMYKTKYNILKNILTKLIEKESAYISTNELKLILDSFDERSDKNE